MPLLLHEQLGLRLQKNDRNGFVVCRLHYTADPRKRSPEWRAAAAQGMSTAQFEQEFEINYTAKEGEKAFPEIFSRRSEIVLREGPYIDNEWPKDLPMWGGFDYGAKNPSAFTVYTVVDGVIYALWEMYGPCRNLNDFSELMKSCPYWLQLRYICYDPTMEGRRSHTAEGDIVSVLAQFQQRGIHKWVRGNNDETAWLSLMSKHWCGKEITFKILNTCPMLIDEFESATYITLSEHQLETQNYREALVDRHNHALDACKYFMNSGAAQAPPKPLHLPSMVASYGWSTGGPRAYQRSARSAEFVR